MHLKPMFLEFFLDAFMLIFFQIRELSDAPKMHEVTQCKWHLHFKKMMLSRETCIGRPPLEH